MSALTLPPARPSLPLPARLRSLVETVRWAPAPRFEGTPTRRWLFVAYLAGSMLAWTLAGVAIAAALGALVR
ncbi:chemotaxis protein CheW [Cellulomonas sp. DKR-3]|uniref:Chemotaxis protein CheW n=1 Tax=Cellulomonas fulva TaxID=2835530 RepID=A0ABS5TX35_9CELL|nr:chemotaxis protein CheW [Cellulomonas fulva]MBT0993688.1 chemotaxis protein CheW [Cellulomonas fulva]